MGIETPSESAPQTSVSAHIRSVPRTRQFRRIRAVPYLFMLPFGVFFIIFFLVPIGYAVYQSFFTTQRTGLGLGAPETLFNGWNNYHAALLDRAFYEGIGRVLLLGIVQVPVMLGLALLFALLLDSAAVRFKSFFRLAFFVPYAIPGIIGALLWGYLYDPQLSPFAKGFLSGVDFLGAGTILWSIANIVTWEFVGYNMLIIFAALQAIPSEIYEAARIDGCTGTSIARYIKVPLVAPALVLTAVFSIIGTLQLFNEPQVLQGISTNISSSYTPIKYAYTTAFVNNNYYYTAALAVILALVTFVFSFGFLRITQRQAGV